MKAVVWTAGLVAILACVGCGLPQISSAPTVCDPAQRTMVLDQILDAWKPSKPFTIPDKGTAWIQDRWLPESHEGLFGDLGAAAEVHSIHSGATPTVITDANGDQEAKDPAIIMDKGLTWYVLTLSPGDWQLYSESNPGIQIVTCPPT